MGPSQLKLRMLLLAHRMLRCISPRARREISSAVARHPGRLACSTLSGARWRRSSWPRWAWARLSLTVRPRREDSPGCTRLLHAMETLTRCHPAVLCALGDTLRRRHLVSVMLLPTGCGGTRGGGAWRPSSALNGTRSLAHARRNITYGACLTFAWISFIKTTGESSWIATCMAVPHACCTLTHPEAH